MSSPELATNGGCRPDSAGTTENENLDKAEGDNCCVESVEQHQDAVEEIGQNNDNNTEKELQQSAEQQDPQHISSDEDTHEKILTEVEVEATERRVTDVPFNEMQEETVPVSDDEENADLTSGQCEFPNESINVCEPAIVDEMSVAKEIGTYVQMNRINIGELDSLEDMWAICDAISAAHAGLPDSLLKEAFLLVLEGAYAYAKNNSWMRNHLDHLTRMWKKELLSGKHSSRPTKFVSASSEYTNKEGTETTEPPQNDEQGKVEEKPGETEQKVAETGQQSDSTSSAKMRRLRRNAAKKKRALAVMMGVGEMLQHARKKFATEEGELDVDEDEYGNFSIGGMELSFEAWGKLNKIKDADVVHSNVKPTKKRKRDEGRHTNGQGSEQITAAAKLPNVGNPPRAPQPVEMAISLAQQFPTVREVEMPEVEKGGQQTKRGKKAAKLAKKQKKEEKDEGEISSTGSEATTSEDESSSDEEQKRRQMKARKTVPAAPAQERRQLRREEERKQGANSAQNLQTLLRKCFDLRLRIVSKLSVQQKAMFRDLIQQSLAGTLEQQGQQALMQLMSSGFAKTNGM